ncbi:MAG: leucine--tRNA ligase [Candidatus Aenigmarchaeota archaeon]|nr:leucine--tRNA ligase [Candidatus Aenigmarchaeota archaeon]
MDFKKVEKKWQKRWERSKIFEADVEKRKKFFTSLIIPYVNGGLHIGHTFTFTRTDAYARYKRMCGFNVLLAQGFHATGEPILGTVERIRNNDKSQLETFRIYGATKTDIKNFKGKGVEYVARFWTKKIIEDMKSVGFSIDWRRVFITAIYPTFSRFIEWQYNTLRKRGFVTQGTHPVIWCPHCKSPTGDHDRLEGEGESPVGYTLLKFSMGDKILPAATLRPETIYGVTNIWVNPESEYVVAKVDGEKWVISESAAQKLGDQLKKVEIIERIKGDELLGKKAKDPCGNKDISILPASFVDTGNTTGIVMSVPSHAPYDWVALKELIESGELEFYGLTKNDVEPVSVVKVEGFGEHPAMEVVKRLGIMSSKEIDKLDEATSIVYKKEFHFGVLRENCGEYAGSKVSEVKEKLFLDFIEAGAADIMWETTGKVVCRCTTKNYVKILENQWFLKFSDENWKKLVRKCLERMRLCPEEARTNFLNTIDWLKDKACARKTGLGTPLPWDKEWIVETLSDSTIYMAYYTIARLINEKKIPAKKLTDGVFDYIFFGKDDVKKVSKSVKLNLKLLQQMRDEFVYFYPMDMRNSGKDLIQNHLTFYLFHHVAVWPENMWPKAIGANGYVNVEGEKMSKSKGNIQPLRDIIKQFGADLVRINIAASNENMDDADWRVEGIKSFRSRYEFLEDLIKNTKKARVKEMRNIDVWLLSKLQKIIQESTKNYEMMKFRTAVSFALFDSTNLLKWYLKRTGNVRDSNRRALQTTLNAIVKMLTPLTPHMCEEFWQMSGGKGFISVAEWPRYNQNLVNIESEIAETLLENTMKGVEDIKKIAKMERINKITLFVAEGWKFRVYNKVLRNKDKGMNEITKEIMQGEAYGQATVNFIQNLYQRLNELKPILPRNWQMQILKEAKKFLEAEFNCHVEIVDSNKTENKKAKQAAPQKLGILLE